MILKRRAITRSLAVRSALWLQNNEAPALDPTALPAFDNVIEDAGAPSGPVGTLVDALVDAGGTHDNFSDSNGDLPGIAITRTNLQGGKLWY